jgi:hypothetical protein
MSTDNLSLLFRLRGDSSGLRTASAQGQQAIRQLKQSFGPELQKTVSVTNKAFNDAGIGIGNLVSRVPVVGNAVSQLTDSMSGLSAQSAVTGASMSALAGPIGIAAAALTAEIAIVVSLTREMFNLAKTTAAYQGKLFDLSQQVGVSVETLSALEIEARKTGGSIDGVSASLGIFQKHLEEAVEDRGSKAAITLQRLGVEATDTETAFRQTVAALAAMPEGFRQTATALELFGRGGKQVLAIAKESRGDIDATINRLRGLGLVTSEQAEQADKFNDQLVILDTQLRGLGTETIPVVLAAIEDLSEAAKENREALLLVQGVLKGLALSVFVPLRVAIAHAKVAFDALRLSFKLAEPVLRVIAAHLKFIRDAIEFINRNPVRSPVTGVTTPITPLQPTDQRDPDTERLKDEIAVRERLQGVLDFALAEQRRRATASIALAQRELEAGKRTRQELLQVTIDGTRQQTKAEVEALQRSRDIKLREFSLAKDDLEKQTQIAGAIAAIDIQVADKQEAQRQRELDLRAKTRLDERKDELTHEQSKLDTLTRLGNERIAVIEEQIRLEQVTREVGLDEIEKIETAALVARGQLLKRELELVGVGPDRQAVLDKIKALEADRTSLERQQSERRKQITRDEFETKRQLAIGGLDALLQVEQIKGSARIATIQALAALRVRTEEQAAREILTIQTDLIDSQIEAIKAQQEAAKGIIDPKERRSVEAQLANDLRVLNAERVALQEQGNRAIDDARQQDLDNEREYADDLRDIRERTVDAQRDVAEEVIRLMIASGARRRDIIRAERELALAEENDRHQRATESIRQQQRETDEQIRVLERRLERLQIGTTEEIEEHDRLIESLERLRTKRDELDAQQEAEDKRTQTRQETITVSAKVELASPDIGLKDLFDSIGESIINLSGKFAGLIGLGKEFNAVSLQMASQLGGILAGAFNQFANALGQTVANWVLLGETGPAVMRKILAQALASLAAEATVQAIKELALGFASLFFNPAEAAAHFTAAGLWASIAGGSALAGRGIAGDLFKDKPKDERSSGGSGSGRDNEPNPIDLARQQQSQRIDIFVHAEPGPGFGPEAVKALIHDISINGPSRDVVVRTAGG